MNKLSHEEVTELLKDLEGWEQSGDSIRKTFTTKGFPQTLGLAMSIGALCERHDHHPDHMTIKYAKIDISFSTHSAGGITGKDIDIAKDIESL